MRRDRVHRGLAQIPARACQERLTEPGQDLCTLYSQSPRRSLMPLSSFFGFLPETSLVSMAEPRIGWGHDSIPRWYDQQVPPDLSELGPTLVCFPPSTMKYYTSNTPILTKEFLK